MRYFLLVFLFLFPASFCRADEPASRGIGAGIMVGTVSSITGKYWFTETRALDFGVGVAPDPWTVLYADYLWHFPRLFGSSTPFARQTMGYVGGGAGIGFWGSNRGCDRWRCGGYSSRTAVFLRGLFGAEWLPDTIPIGVFLELGPSIAITPFTGGAFDFGLGVRYYF